MIGLLRRHALRLAHSFDLPLRAVQPESRRVRSRYGACYSDGTIKIRLRSVRDLGHAMCRLSALGASDDDLVDERPMRVEVGVGPTGQLGEIGTRFHDRQMVL